MCTRTEGVNYNFRENSGNPYAYLSHGAACSEVEIDCLTGDHKVRASNEYFDFVGHDVSRRHEGLHRHRDDDAYNDVGPEH